MPEYIVALASALAKASVDNIARFNERVKALEEFKVSDRPSGDSGWMVRGTYDGTPNELREGLGYLVGQIRIELHIEHHPS